MAQISGINIAFFVLELLIAIQIPTKQPLLRVGKAILRIRNTGFTITTCENPPRCQGTWQIIHIRKYGGSDIFRFQTGKKIEIGYLRSTVLCICDSIYDHAFTFNTNSRYK